MPDFAGLGDFLRFLPQLVADIEVAQQRGREAATELVRQEVVAMLGEYQHGDTGPFPAWATLQDATTEAAGRRGFDADAPELVTGALRGSVSAHVEADGQAVVGVADVMVGSGATGDEFRNIGDVAVAQELGTDTIPQRSFLGVGAYRAASAAADAFAVPVIAALVGFRRPFDRQGEMRRMAMIDAYRIGVELVLGGNLAAGIEALVSGLERLDTGTTHANAEAAELAAGLRDVAEAAPGIGRAADQLGRLSSAMAVVNQAVEAWRSHGGVPEVGLPGQAGSEVGTTPRAAAGRLVGLPTELPDVAMRSGMSHGNNGPLVTRSRPPGALVLPSVTPGGTQPLGGGDREDTGLIAGKQTYNGFDAVLPAMLASERVTGSFGRFDGAAKEADLLAGQTMAGLVSPVGGPTADAAKDVAEVYASAAHVLPTYVENAVAPGRSEREEPGALVEPIQGGDLKSVIEPSGQGPGRARIEEFERVMPILSQHGRKAAMGEALVEPHPIVQQSAPVVSMPGLDMPVRERAPDDPTINLHSRAGLGRAPLPPGLAIPANEPPAQSDARASSHALAALASGALREMGATRLDGNPNLRTATPPWFGNTLGGSNATLEGLSSRVMALGMSGVKEGSVGPTGRGSLSALTNSIVALNGAVGKKPEERPGAAHGAKALGLEAVGAGFAPSLTAPYHDQGGRSGAPHSQGYHPQGDQPGPVIQHITYIHLDDREIARAVTRQQLRMMGGNVSGTLRPDPSIAPQYGAHLLRHSMVDISSVLGALSTLATGGSVSLGTITFVGFEVPPKINFGGTTVLVVHKFPGGARVIDSMGDDPVAPEWSGTFTGPFAAVRARQVNAMRLAGQPVQLSFGPFSAQVVIKRFSADYQRNGYWIPYRLSCEVLPPQPEAASVGGTALAGLIGDDTASALASVSDAASQVADVAATAAAQVSSVLARMTPLGNIVGIDLSPINYALNTATGIVVGVTNLAEAPAAAAQSFAQLQSGASGIGSALGAVGAGISSINGTAVAVGGTIPWRASMT